VPYLAAKHATLTEYFSVFLSYSKKIVIRESRKSPGVAQRVPGGLDSQIS